MIIKQQVKFFIYCANLIVNDLDTDKAFGSMYQISISKIKEFFSEEDS